MKKMAGYILMLVGVIIFGSGAFVLSSAIKAERENSKMQDLDKVIDMAMADGVLTNNERQLIKKVSEEKGDNYNEIIQGLEKQLASQEEEAETTLVDISKKKGDDFEKYIVKKFDSAYFKLKEWAGDKYVDGIYAETTAQPDLLYEFRLRNCYDIT